MLLNFKILVEAQLSRFDNIMIPIVGMWIFSYFE